MSRPNKITNDNPRRTPKQAVALTPFFIISQTTGAFILKLVFETPVSRVFRAHTKIARILFLNESGKRLTVHRLK